jgi:hypothetical protein
LPAAVAHPLCGNRLGFVALLCGAAFCFNQQKALHIAGLKAIWSGASGAATPHKTSSGLGISAALPRR